MMHFKAMKLSTLRYLFLGAVTTALVFQTAALAEKPANKKLILIAGKPSHGPGDHEFNPGHGIDTTDGRTYTQVIVDGLVDVGHRLNNLKARGIL
jgi:hypothetical protein